MSSALIIRKNGSSAASLRFHGGLQLTGSIEGIEGKESIESKASKVMKVMKVLKVKNVSKDEVCHNHPFRPP